MKTTTSFLSKKSWIFLLALLPLLIPGASVAQTDTEAVADMAILPWLGTWIALDETSTPGTTVLEIRPGADGRGLDITTKDADQPVGEIIIPDGVSRPAESSACAGTRTFQWEKQTGVLLGRSEIVCQGEASYTVFTLKMMTAADRLADILVIKTPDLTRLAVRRFAFEKDLQAAGDSFRAQESLVLRTVLAAPWDLDKIISLSKTVETVVLEAALLERNLQVKLDTKALRKMKSAGTPDSIIDLLVAMSAPDKFRIETNDQVAVQAASSSRLGNGETYSNPYVMAPPYYYGYYYPWGNYWSYGSPFWWGYPIYTHPGFISGGGSGGGGGGAGGGTSGNSGGRLSSGSGYIQITPRDTGHQAVPRGNVMPGAGRAVPSGGSAGYSAGAGAVSSGVGSAGYSSGAGSSSSGGGSGSSGTSASPSGYSGGGTGGTAVPR